MIKTIDFTPLAHLGLLAVYGEDAKRFLQGQLTCDLETITETSASLGAHCNPQGRVISLFKIIANPKGYYLQMPFELIPIALKALQKYAVFFKVSLIDESASLNQLGFNTTKENAEKQHQFEISQQIPSIFPETSEKFLPHELNLPNLNAISFTKGCYTGQEIIARMQYRGKLKKQLFRAHLQSETPPVRYQDIYTDNQIIGKLVDYSQIDTNRYEVLILIPDNQTSHPLLFINSDKKNALNLIH